MSKPIVHAKSSARRFGGRMEDYLPIHQLMDSSKSGIADNRHRVFTHNSWFISAGGPLEMIFGIVIVNSDNREVAVRDIGEQHILEDFGNKFIPTPQDYLEHMDMVDWMNGGAGEPPSSCKQLKKNTDRIIKRGIEEFLKRDNETILQEARRPVELID